MQRVGLGDEIHVNAPRNLEESTPDHVSGIGTHFTESVQFLLSLRFLEEFVAWERSVNVSFNGLVNRWLVLFLDEHLIQSIVFTVGR